MNRTPKFQEHSSSTRLLRERGTIDRNITLSRWRFVLSIVQYLQYYSHSENSLKFRDNYPEDKTKDFEETDLLRIPVYRTMAKSLEITIINSNAYPHCYWMDYESNLWASTGKLRRFRRYWIIQIFFAGPFTIWVNQVQFYLELKQVSDVNIR